ncbi:SLAM family member 8 [Alligator sinensis]|uniref:SLAM family member 8 n=1 Tax=Alligator sinensis TaxID=38654 RepID=A0A1U7RUW4_ALLSI|nr:SLAM family member 8 [Alligator sinensis]
MAAWLLLTLLLYQALLAAAHGSVQVTGIVGKPVLLHVNVPPGFQVRDAIWRYLSPKEELVATFFRGSSETLYQSRFHGRSRLHKNLTLEIGQVELGDNGTFSALLVNTRGHIETRTLHLAVYEVVSQLAVQVFTSTGQNSSAGACEVFLTCGASKGTNVTYSWRRAEGAHLHAGTHSFFEAGQVLRVQLGPGDRTACYTCTAVNAVSQVSVTIVPWKHCHKEEGVAASKYDYRDILLIALPLAVLAISMVTMGILHSWKRSGKHRIASLADACEAEPVPV